MSASPNSVLVAAEWVVRNLSPTMSAHCLHMGVMIHDSVVCYHPPAEFPCNDRHGFFHDAAIAAAILYIPRKEGFDMSELEGGAVSEYTIELVDAALSGTPHEPDRLLSSMVMVAFIATCHSRAPRQPGEYSFELLQMQDTMWDIFDEWDAVYPCIDDYFITTRNALRARAACAAAEAMGNPEVYRRLLDPRFGSVRPSPVSH